MLPRLSLAVLLLINFQGVGKDVFEPVGKELFARETVLDVFRDETGYLWVTATNGLFRYDGFVFNRVILSWSADPRIAGFVSLNGVVFIGTDVGLFAYRNDRLSEVVLEEGINALFKYKGSILAITASGAWELDLQASKHQEVELQDQDVLTLSGDSIWTYRQGYTGFWYDSLYHKEIKSAARPGHFVTHEGFLLMASNKEVRIHNRSDSVTLKLDHEVRDITVDGHDNLWIATWGGGLYRYHLIEGKIQHYKKDIETDLPVNYLSSLFIDQEGLLWIGTAGTGVVKYNYSRRTFEHLSKQTIQDEGLMGNSVWSILPYEDILFIGTENGINAAKLDENNRIQLLPVGGDFNNEPRIVKSMFIDSNGDLWVGTLGQGVIKTRISNHPTVEVSVDETLVSDYSKHYSISSNYIFDITEGQRNHMWLATDNGMNVLRPGGSIHDIKHNRSVLSSLGSNQVNLIEKGPDGAFWIGTQGSGVDYLSASQLENNQIDSYKFDHILLSTVDAENRNITQVYFHQDQVMVGTLSGLMVLSNAPKFSDSLLIGVNEESITNIETAANGEIWLTTLNEIIRLDETNRTVEFFGQDQGYHFNDFNINSSIRWSDHIFFGSKLGIYFFNPAEISSDRYVATFVITDLLINNQSVFADYRSSMTAGNELLLNHDEHSFKVEFSLLSFVEPMANRYQYRLVGFSDQWINCSGSDRRATFTNIDPGSYVLEIRNAGGGNRDALEPFRLDIRVLAPWWLSGWAYVAYAIVLTAVSLGVYRIIVIRERFKADLVLKEVEASKLREIDELKTRFFVNLSHEFKTPLTLILDPLQRLIETDSKNGQLKVVQRNAQRLHSMINELLDIARLEEGKLKLNKQEGHIADCLNSIMENFLPYAKERGIDFKVETDQPGFTMIYDPLALEKVLNNFLSNAFKHTSKGGSVKLYFKYSEMDEYNCRFGVRDDGFGISEDNKHNIFDRFYMSKTSERGTGIGLALCKELTDLMNGQIRVESQPGQGSDFWIDVNFERAEENHTVLEGLDMNTQKPLLLTIEDDRELTEYLTNCLSSFFEVISAYDGTSGIEMAIRYVPDIIVSDINMPGQDGREVVKRLKENINSSHIPLLLLTASTDEELRDGMLRAGIDDYITKPFKTKHLTARLEGILKQRDIVRKKFGHDLMSRDRKIDIPTTQEKFLKQLEEAIEHNHNNSAFTIEDLSKEMGMSRVQIHRKLTALFGISISDYIRGWRLRKAAALLSGDYGNVSDIAYEVGFSNLSYFTKSFKERYGKTPSEYAKKAM